MPMPKSVDEALDHIAKNMAMGLQEHPHTRLVCGLCKEPWEALGSPDDCPRCGRFSYAVSNERRSGCYLG